MSQEMKLPSVRTTFCFPFSARDYKNNGVFKFRSGFVVEKTSPIHKKIEASMLAACEEAWPGKGAVMLRKYKGDKTTCCYRPGDEEDENLKGKMVLTASRMKTKGRPKIVDRRGNALTEEDGKPYSGCYVNAIVDIWAQKGETPGVRCELMGMQFVKDGEAFGGGKNLGDDAFDDLGDDENDVDDVGEEDADDLA